LSYAALLLISLNWLAVALVDLPTLVHPQIAGSSGLREIMISLSQPLDAVAILLAVGLKRAARVQVLLAGVLMSLCWPLGYV
jgi:hypothetical protein